MHSTAAFDGATITQDAVRPRAVHELDTVSFDIAACR